MEAHDLEPHDRLGPMGGNVRRDTIRFKTAMALFASLRQSKTRDHLRISHIARCRMSDAIERCRTCHMAGLADLMACDHFRNPAPVEMDDRGVLDTAATAPA